MQPDPSTFLRYKRARFVTQLPLSYRYSASHYWLTAADPGIWRVGLTKFATRMLGEMVECSFDVGVGAPVEVGQILGWVEGFKAISDVFCAGRGRFLGANPLLTEKISAIDRDPYGAGWLYALEGEPDPHCVDVQAYARILDKTIDKILEREKNTDQ